MESKRSSTKLRMMLILAIGERPVIKSTERLKMILRSLSKAASILKKRSQRKLKKNRCLLLKSKKRLWKKGEDRIKNKRKRRERNSNYSLMIPKRLISRSIWMTTDSRQFMKTQCIPSIQWILASIIAGQAKSSRKSLDVTRIKADNDNQ